MCLANAMAVAMMLQIICSYFSFIGRNVNTNRSWGHQNKPHKCVHITLMYIKVIDEPWSQCVWWVQGVGLWYRGSKALITNSKDVTKKMAGTFLLHYCTAVGGKTHCPSLYMSVQWWRVSPVRFMKSLTLVFEAICHAPESWQWH